MAGQMKGILKKLRFRDGTETEVMVFRTWEVRWASRYDIYSGSTRPEIEIFPNEEDARAFADALIDAYKLIRHTSGTEVTVQGRD